MPRESFIGKCFIPYSFKNILRNKGLSFSTRNTKVDRTSMNLLSREEIRSFLKSNGIKVSDKESDDFSKGYSDLLSKGDIVHTFKTKIKDFDCIVKTNSASPEFVGFIFHGFGANKDDLSNIFDIFFAMNSDLKICVIHPDAVMPLNGDRDSFCWWKLDVNELSRRIMNFDLESILNDVPEGLDVARKSTLKLINESAKKLNVPIEKVFLVGFSQGSMLCLDLLFNVETAPFYLGLFSCGPMMQNAWRNKLKTMNDQRKNEICSVPIFQTHGTFDMVIPVIGGNCVTSFLKKEGFKNVEYKQFSGDHTIEENLLDEFLKKLASKARSKLNS